MKPSTEQIQENRTWMRGLYGIEPQPQKGKRKKNKR